VQNLTDCNFEKLLDYKVNFLNEENRNF